MKVNIELTTEGFWSSNCDESSFRGTVSEYDKETETVGIAIHSALKGVGVCRAICALAVAVDMFRHGEGFDEAEESFCEQAASVIQYWEDIDNTRMQQREI